MPQAVSPTSGCPEKPEDSTGAPIILKAHQIKGGPEFSPPSIVVPGSLLPTSPRPTKCPWVQGHEAHITAQGVWQKSLGESENPSLP